MSKALHEYLSPKHKVLDFLKKGHDALRGKYAALMVRHRRAENQVRAVTKSRENWETRAKLAEAELQELKKRVGDAGNDSGRWASGVS